MTIVIDPGHGASDPGHLSTNKKHRSEKDINLIIAKKLGHYLENNIQNVKVIYTRETDVYRSLDKRVEVANQQGVDLFISIHCNGGPRISSYGTETHIYDRTSRNSLKWAKMVEKEFKTRVGRRSRGVKTNMDRGETLQVLKYTKGTAILVECGFMTNVNEAKFLNSDRGHDLLSSALFRATRSYLKQHFPKINFIKEVKTSKPEEPVLAKGKYRVQICSTTLQYDPKGDKFSHLKFDVHQVVLTGKIKYKYFLGPFPSKAKAEEAMKNAQSGGYKDAFIVKNQ